MCAREVIVQLGRVVPILMSRFQATATFRACTAFPATIIVCNQTKTFA